MPASSDESPVPAPFIVAPTGQWDGDDGAWSTFALEIGTPPQSFRVLPSTVGEEIWVPEYGACEGPLVVLSDCGDLRGVNNINGAASRGFSWNESTSWTSLGIYEIGTAEDLFPNPNNTGSYGEDDVSLGRLPGDGYGPSIANQVVAGITTEDFWLGSIGLGTSPGEYGSSSAFSLLYSMKAQNLTTSLSYGYTAGQSYASPNITGSLVLGGYDNSRIKQPTVSMPINLQASTQELQLGLRSIIATNTLQGLQQALLSAPVIASIDSTVSQLWLPQDACDSFAEAFGLIYDETKELYFVNSTTHKTLQANSPSFTFTVGSETGGPTTNIVFDYNAFDLNVSIPLTNFSTPYFPIRRAANDSQVTLGRAFLQEAYIVVDWERGNLTIGQTVAQTSDTEIVPILPVSQSTPSSGGSPGASKPGGSTKSSGLQSGTIAGVVVALVLVFVIAGGFGFWFGRRKRRSKKGRSLNGDAPEVHGAVEHYGTDKEDEKIPDYMENEVPAELHSPPFFTPVASPIYELEEPYDRELMSSPVLELYGSAGGSELDVSQVPGADSSKEKSTTDVPGGQAESEGSPSGSTQLKEKQSWSKGDDKEGSKEQQQSEDPSPVVSDPSPLVSKVESAKPEQSGEVPENPQVVETSKMSESEPSGERPQEKPPSEKTEQIHPSEDSEQPQSSADNEQSQSSADNEQSQPSEDTEQTQPTSNIESQQSKAASEGSIPSSRAESQRSNRSRFIEDIG